MRTARIRGVGAAAGVLLAMDWKGLAIGAVLAAAATAPSLAANKPGPATGPTVANPPASRTLGSAGAWTAYISEDRSGKVCYLVGQPQKSFPAALHRQASAMVTHRPQENIANVVSFVVGVPLKDGSDVTLALGKKEFKLFTKNDAAWASTSDLDKEVVQTLAKSRDVIAKGVPQRGAGTSDTYSLAGFDKALAMIDKACGVRR
jgi:invasion protein IalB